MRNLLAMSFGCVFSSIWKFFFPSLLAFLGLDRFVVGLKEFWMLEMRGADELSSCGSFGLIAIPLFKIVIEWIFRLSFLGWRKS